MKIKFVGKSFGAIVAGGPTERAIIALIIFAIAFIILFRYKHLKHRTASGAFLLQKTQGIQQVRGLLLHCRMAILCRENNR